MGLWQMFHSDIYNQLGQCSDELSSVYNLMIKQSVKIQACLLVYGMYRSFRA